MKPEEEYERDDGSWAALSEEIAEELDQDAADAGLDGGPPHEACGQLLEGWR